MSSLAALNRDGEKIQIDGKHIDALRAALRGTLLTAESPGYDDSRLLWNGMIDRRPALVARCISTASFVWAGSSESVFSVAGVTE